MIFGSLFHLIKYVFYFRYSISLQKMFILYVSKHFLSAIFVFWQTIIETCLISLFLSFIITQWNEKQIYGDVCCFSRKILKDQRIYDGRKINYNCPEKPPITLFSMFVQVQMRTFCCDLGWDGALGR